MGLLVSILIFLMLGLLIFQVWQLWFTRRELARLEQRLSESLDDQDLLEFQDRLKGLLAETKDAGLSLVQTIERRQDNVEKVIAKAVEAEKRLSVRAQLLELAAKELAKQAPAPAKAPTTKPKPVAAKKPAAPPAKAPEMPIAASESSEAEKVSAAAEEEDRRSYLSRPPAVAVGASRHQRVYELSDQGLSREQIAREAGILPGEVELILNLRPGKRRSK